jgi:hypothetical protein
MKIAICTPCYLNTTADYSYSLAKMLLRTSAFSINYNGAPTVPEFEIFIWGSSLLPVVRNTLARKAVDWGANYLLWIDADHAFPDDALLRLLSLNVRSSAPII